MAEPRTPPPEHATDAPTRDADAPKRDAGAPNDGGAAPKDGAGTPVSSTRPALSDAPAANDAPPAPERSADAPSPGVPPRELYAYLSLEATQDRIRQVVRANVPAKTRRDVFDDVVQEANFRALRTKSPPSSRDKLRAWISSVAKNAAIDHFRRDTVKRGWENREVDVEQLPPEAAHAPVLPDEAETEPWMISAWLEKRVAHHETDRLTYDLIVEKAREEKTYEQLAAERGESVAALKSRVHEFKKKYVPLRRRHEERRDTFLFWLHFGRDSLLVAAVVAALVLAFLYRMGLGPFAPEPPPRPALAPFRSVAPEGDLVGHPPPP
jgi:DNA-directed RNA polymerase specialized sigma24 family protein